MEHQMLPVWLEIGSAVILTLLLIFVLTKNYIVSLTKQEEIIVPDSNKQTDLIVPGMTCNNCVTHVKNALVKLSGVENVNIDLNNKNVKIIHTNIVNKDKMVLAVEDSGYQVSNK